MSAATVTQQSVLIRSARPEDAQNMARIAGLDSQPVPALPALLAVVDGEPRAALSLATGAVVADPFHHTAELVKLLQLRARPAAKLRRKLFGDARHALAAGR